MNHKDIQEMFNLQAKLYEIKIKLSTMGQDTLTDESSTIPQSPWRPRSFQPKDESSRSLSLKREVSYYMGIFDFYKKLSDKINEMMSTNTFDGMTDDEKDEAIKECISNTIFSGVKKAREANDNLMKNLSKDGMYVFVDRVSENVTEKDLYNLGMIQAFDSLLDVFTGKDI